MSLYLNNEPPFALTAQEKHAAYSSHSYNTSLSPPAVSAPPQESDGRLHKNGDPNISEHSVVNIPAATPSDTITLHTGRVRESIFLPLFVLLVQLCLFMFSKIIEVFFSFLLLFSIITQKGL